jgi:hypothetical protein
MIPSDFRFQTDLTTSFAPIEQRKNRYALRNGNMEQAPLPA